MADTEKELPEEIETKIEPGTIQMDLKQRPVALEFVHGDRPFYNISQMRSALDVDVSRDTVGNRMNELNELGIVVKQQVNNGDIYWLNHEESEWPIPPDIEPVPTTDEITVSEWRRKPHVQTAAMAIFTVVFGTTITLFGVFQPFGNLPNPINESLLIALGLTMGMVSYLVFLFAGILWIVDIPDLEQVEFSELLNQ